MLEREEDVCVRKLFAERYGVCLRKLPESNVKTPDYELVGTTGRSAVVEVKRLERTPKTSENGWRVTEPSGWVTRDDNAPSRVGALIHNARRQFSAFTDPKILVFVNDEPLMDDLDMQEAFDGFLLYGNDQVGYYKNRVSAKVAEGRIREEKWQIDLYVWIDRYKNGDPVFRYTTETGRDLARRFFRCPD